jgi:alpha-galactosidase
MGLKFGLYGCAGQQTCAGFPGSEGHEKSDVAQLVGWEVDFWYAPCSRPGKKKKIMKIQIPNGQFLLTATRKYDNCYTPCYQNPRPQTCQNPTGSSKTWYTPMRDAIIAAEATKKLHFNLCNWGRDQVWTWGADYGHSWRYISPFRFSLPPTKDASRRHIGHSEPEVA